MSNFSNVGFTVNAQEELIELMNHTYVQGVHVEVNEGLYTIYKDASQAEIWGQVNNQNEYAGINPHYRGKSKRRVRLTNELQCPHSELNGSFYAWAAPEADNPEPESGQYPFVFHVPNAKVYTQVKFPQDLDIQLTAFAQEMSVFANETAFQESQAEEEVSWATQSFIPSGLFSPEGGHDDAPKAYAIFTGVIKEFELKTNAFTQESFYWLLVDTLGGEVDVVADPRYFGEAPQVGGVVSGQFWLSGHLLSPPEQLPQESSKGLFSKWF